jgi:hypothetical protein
MKAHQQLVFCQLITTANPLEDRRIVPTDMDGAQHSFVLSIEKVPSSRFLAISSSSWVLKKATLSPKVARKWRKLWENTAGWPRRFGLVKLLFEPSHLNYIQIVTSFICSEAKTYGLCRLRPEVT